MLQVFTGFETKNRYRVLDSNGNDILYAYEESGFMGRQFLGNHRPLTLNIIDGNGKIQLIARRKFFWFLSHLELLSPDGTSIGQMQRRFKIIGRRFDLSDDQGDGCSVDGPMLRPNTFWIRRNGVEMARITKQWSGLTREMFTAADTFGIEFTSDTLSESMRWLILGAAFAIDLDFFERRGRGSGFHIGGFGPGGVSGRGF